MPPEEILVKIHKQLRFVLVLLGTKGRGTRSHIDRAQGHLEKLLGRTPVLVEGESPRQSARGHLEEANALAAEHLETSGRGGRARREIRVALQKATKELNPD